MLGVSHMPSHWMSCALRMPSHHCCSASRSRSGRPARRAWHCTKLLLLRAMHRTKGPIPHASGRIGIAVHRATGYTSVASGAKCLFDLFDPWLEEATPFPLFTFGSIDGTPKLQRFMGLTALPSLAPLLCMRCVACMSRKAVRHLCLCLAPGRVLLGLSYAQC
ncbi:hypothetical protein HAX54_033203, partial [Datura stramonium]|nr:hypothetical protein [Datura stramonium]